MVRGVLNNRGSKTISSASDVEFAELMASRKLPEPASFMFLTTKVDGKILPAKQNTLESIRNQRMREKLMIGNKR